MATAAPVNWAGLTNAAYQKLVQANSQAVRDTATANLTKLNADNSYKTANKSNVEGLNINAADRGMGRSGPQIQRQSALATSFQKQLDLSRTNNLATLTKIAQNKIAAKTNYDKTLADIKARQTADTLSRIAQLPQGINFAALRAADPAYKK